ncbi:hypothetical protein HPB48_001415 [Haemaphysalis longicornis]|uniref:Endonuclease/exonuclease/phosphatase domain-containing protein n=1 Tax=Haemaphysalis longicornis TaxID=44386 RepID=A0A9J6GNE6_HAELO|nr:hypothetical protein HPB48_001415 [Haemaphysalis longicornis]
MSSMTIYGSTIEFDGQLLTSHGCSPGVIGVDTNDPEEDLRSTQEVVAVRFRVGRRNFTVASTYVRARTAQHASTRVNFFWMRRHSARYPHDAAVFAGDFNAENKSWGYQISCSRGLQLLEEADEAELHLVNDLSQATRRRQNPGQPTANGVATLSREPTPWSSDHYPIEIQLSGIDKKCRKRVLYTNWQRFRDLLIQPTRHDGPDKPCPEYLDCILRAAQAATSISDVDGESPPPDRHLVKLWNHRDELEEMYIAGGHSYHDLGKIRQQTAKMRHHAKLLARHR